MKNKKYLPWSELPPIEIPKNCYDSQKRALSKLVNQATGMKADAEGNLDPEQYYLNMVESTGTAISVGGLRHFLGGVEVVRFKSKQVKKSLETPPDEQLLMQAADSIWKSEVRLNRFLIKLGKKLASKKKRGKPLWVPDWGDVKEVENLIVHGWCESITVEGEKWPPLCCLTYEALLNFLKLCKRPFAGANSDIDAFRQSIWRLGLVSIPTNKITSVEKKGRQFLFI